MDHDDRNTVESLMSQLDVSRPERERVYVICLSPHEPRMLRARALRMLELIGTVREQAILLVDAYEERREHEFTKLIVEFERRAIEAPVVSIKILPERESYRFQRVYRLPNFSNQKNWVKVQRRRDTRKRY